MNYLLIFIAMSGLLYSNANANIPTIKVKIASSLKSINIHGQNLKRHLVETGRKKDLPGKSSIAFNCSKVAWKNWKKRPQIFAVIEAEKNVLQWEGHKYLGKIQVQTAENYKGCDLVNEIDVEEYISMVLPKEMNASWPIEALKAQAIAARSYALYKIRNNFVTKVKGYNTHYDLENSEKHQVNGNYSDITPKTIQASKETRGEILINSKEEKLPIFFHSKCGGHTFLPEEVWSNPVTGYEKVQCPYCYGHGLKNWKLSLKDHTFMNYYKKALNRYQGKALTNNSKGYRLFKNNEYDPIVKLYGGPQKVYSVKKSRLRSTLTRKNLPSNNFKIKIGKETINIEGAGFGHGVGLCQFGAKEMALRGYSYKEILKHYFPKLKISKVY